MSTRAPRTIAGHVARALLAITLLVNVVPGACAEWNPESFADEDVLDFLTVGADEGEHWSRVWVAVVDGELYIRLGSRAAERIQGNTRAPIVKVRIAGQEFDRVRADSAPAMAERVAAVMAEKYWSDLLIRYFPHPLTLKLAPEAD